VATSAVINVDPKSSGAAELQWLGATPAGWGEDVGVALIPDSTDQSWRSTVTAFAETLNDGFAGDLMVVGAPPVLEAANQGAARAGAQLRAIEAEGSFAQRARTAVETGRHSVLVFVAAPALPLPDWLPSMLALFARYPRAGIVGTRILSPLGALEEAGGILAADGARRRRGEGDVNPDRPEYCFVKRVEFCSRPLLATTRRLFERLKGFDGGAPGSVDALADFSLRAFQSDARVYYQPGARVVRIGQGEQ
jgi:hypothetical protein